MVCLEHDDGLCGSPASSEGILWTEDSLYKKAEQQSEGEQGPSPPWITAHYNLGVRGKFMSWSKPVVLPSIRPVCFSLSGQCTTAHASALAPVPMMTLPFFAQKVDCYFLSYAYNLTQIWDACETSCKLPMAKANTPILALQWYSFTVSCPHLLIRKGFLVCTSVLSGVEIALMDRSLHGFSCAAGILDLHHWDATLGLDRVGLTLIWHRNWSCMEHTPSARAQDTVTLGPLPFHPYLKGPMFCLAPQTTDQSWWF